MAEWLGWNGPHWGKGSVEDVVSHQPQVRKSLDGHANAIARYAASNLSLHRKTGAAQIHVVGAPPRDLDWWVYLADPTDKRAPASIEFGHWAGKLGSKEGPLEEGHSRTWVEGLHPLGDAVQKAVRKGGMR